MLTIQVEQDRVRIGERFSLSFQRTLRIPDDGKTYPLPPGFNAFPIRRVADFAGRTPVSWKKDGLFFAMYQREATWLAFDAAAWKPNAVKVGTGRINALTGEAWDIQLQDNPQDYLVCPEQPWLDGFNTGQGVVRQFVAMPLGKGYSAEGQLTGREQFGGVQIVVYEPVPGRFPDQPPPQPEPSFGAGFEFALEMPASEMGLAAGGKLGQKIYPDPYGIEAWDPANYAELEVYILNSAQFEALTGEPPPPTPVSPQTYQEYRLPWFDLYDDEMTSLASSEKLTGIQSVREKDAEKGLAPGEDETSLDVDAEQIKKLNRKGKRKE